MSIETLVETAKSEAAQAEIEEDASATSPVVVAMADGKVRAKKKQTVKNSDVIKVDRKLGRPAMHPFEGRVTFLKEETELAITDPEAFIAKMEAAHHLTDERKAQLVLAEKINAEYTVMNYTFLGDIRTVLNEMNTTIKKWNSAGASCEYDFHKKKPITNESSPYFVKAKEERRVLQDGTSANVTTQVEAYPDIVYGYLTVRIPNNQVA